VSHSAAVTVIGAGRHRLGATLREIWSFRELLYFLVWRDAKVRYRQTVLGVLWALVQPLLTVILFTIVFGRFARMPSDGQPYALFALVALVPWTYFATAVGSSANSLVGSTHLISKVYFPRLLIPLGAVITPLIDLAVTFSLVLVALAWYGVWPPLAVVVLLPLFTALVVTTALSVGLWCSALNVRYRDVRYVLPFLTQVWLFATPVAYPASSVPEIWRALYGLNPMATVVEGFRWALLGTPLSPPMAIVSVVAVTAILGGGLAYFRKMEGTFADRV
jgi:lipopolysaccharide transport system permease protein